MMRRAAGEAIAEVATALWVLALALLAAVVMALWCDDHEHVGDE